MLDLDAPGLGQFLFIGAGLHLAGPAAIENGDILGTQQFRLDGDVDRRHAAADHQHAAAHRQLAQVLGLAQFGDVIDRILDALDIFVSWRPAH